MPLKCYSPDGPIHAFDLTREQFEALRLKHRDERHLFFQCCDGQVGLRAPAKGRQHFFHVKQGGCRYEKETQEHLEAKIEVMAAVRDAGWHAEAEVQDEAGTWRADVLATKTGMRPVAIEVQWSRQTQAVTAERQARYAKSRVRGLWLFQHGTYQVCKEVPAFQIRKADFPLADGKFEVLVSPPAEWEAMRQQHPDHWISLRTLIREALSGHLHWAKGGSARRFKLNYGVQREAPCKCGTHVVVPYYLEAVPLDILNHRPYLWHHCQRWRYPPKWLDWFTRQANRKSWFRKLAYAKAATDGRYYGYGWFCPTCHAQTSGGDSMHSQRSFVVDMPPLPLPQPSERSPEANFCHRWWVDLGDFF